MSLVSSTLAKKTNFYFSFFFNKSLTIKFWIFLIFSLPYVVLFNPFSKFVQVHVLAKDEVYLGMSFLKYFPMTIVDGLVILMVRKCYFIYVWRSLQVGLDRKLNPKKRTKFDLKSSNEPESKLVKYPNGF